ncbi:MAG TPA: ATP-binding protein [Ramlibacter sp.]|uniref:HAMP domain-containing sensor histidine kinase n=1 Tax=Ramlibacter sp. TaxID=1917967 RepID=UPI002D63A58F|nr:ATP-binding protein [Ramlibacter sp.]HZY17316.1 ATP-binding protein [Ramlibacter sp.]
MTLRFPLYLRIWLAVVAGVAVLTLASGWLLSRTAEQSPERDVIIRNEAGDVLGQARTRPIRVPGQGVEFQVAMNDGSSVVVQLPRRSRAPGEGPPPPRSWGRGATPFLWMLAIVALAVAVATYPIIRRLTQRLEDLRVGVERWGEGDLSVRVAESGGDEVASLARRFNHAAQRVESLLQSHKSLLANASHELRSPLARIRMGLELMDGPPTPRQKDEMLRNIGELDQLIDEILLASRLDARETDVGTFEPVDLTGLAAEECARADAELSAPGGAELVVHGVSKLLRRAIRNLLENARRYSTGAIEVEIRREAGQAELRVCDHGPGVPPAQRERIFEPFYRLPGASEREGGVGLGLALVRSIAQRHQGTVHCEGREGGGACFVLRLPL